MNQTERRLFLIRALLSEEPRLRDLEVPRDADGQRALLRSLMNVRPPRPCAPEVLAAQDAYLLAERERRGVVNVADIATGADPGAVTTRDGRMLLWQGDITRLGVDAIVNAANSQMLGCFVPCHGCIDNAIHSAAGIELRLACAELMEAQGAPEPTGAAKITPGFNLPANHVIHTVGPIVAGRRPSSHDRELLASCYLSCLELAAARELASIAFCCISTGEFGYPAAKAADVATETVRRWLDGRERQDLPAPTVVFNVFTDRDRELYRSLLGPRTRP